MLDELLVRLRVARVRQIELRYVYARGHAAAITCINQ